MAEDNADPSSTILPQSPDEENSGKIHLVKKLLLVTSLKRLLEDLKRATKELLARGIIFEDEWEKLEAAIDSFYGDPEALRNCLQGLSSRLYEFGYPLNLDFGGGSSSSPDPSEGYVQEVVNVGVRCYSEMTKLKDAIAVTIKNMLIELNLDDSGGCYDSGLSANLKERTEGVLENGSITNVAAGTSLGSEKSERLISSTTSTAECSREETAAGSVVSIFDLRDDTTSSEEEREDTDDQEADEQDSNGEGLLGEDEDGGSNTGSEEIDDGGEEAAAAAAINDSMNNSLESGLNTNIEGLSEEMSELMRKMKEEEDDDQSPKAINLKNLMKSLYRKPRGDL